MNRYPLWKYILVAVVLALGLFYTSPNFFGQAPAVQIGSAKATVKVDASMVARVNDVLGKSAVATTSVRFVDGPSPSVQVRLANEEAQAKASTALDAALNPDKTDPVYVVALNSVSAAPAWMASIPIVPARPVYLGLDLRGGVHFLLQVDTHGVLTKRIDSMVADGRSLLRDKTIRHNGIARNGDVLEVKFSDQPTAQAGLNALQDAMPDAAFEQQQDGSGFKVSGTIRPASLKTIQDDAIHQNITTLHNRINALGTSEPVIQQQGPDRIVVELPGIKDPTLAKDVIGRTATLEVHMVDQSGGLATDPSAGSITYPERRGDGASFPVAVKKDVIITGDRITGADANIDQNGRPDVNITLDSVGGRAMRDLTRDNVGKRMAIVLFDRGRGEIISDATIQGEFANKFQISGSFSSEETTKLALLLRSGSLAAPMDFIEERTIGPSLGADNIQRGLLSTVYGFTAIAVFMVIYYVLFGLVSVIALGSNLLLLMALLSMIQATLTLPGIAAIALTLGMAIDANVLINERIREELRNGAAAQNAISTGYERAFNTILDSNITTLIAGLALLAFGSGAVRGFAVVHCLGILTSIFSSVVVSRAIVNLIYGGKKRLAKIAIGQVWKSQTTAVK